MFYTQTYDPALNSPVAPYGPQGRLGSLVTRASVEAEACCPSALSLPHAGLSLVLD